MPFSKIVSTGSYLPEKVVSNKDLEKLVDTNDEWIVQRVGIRSRRVVSKGQNSSFMAYEAAKKAIAAANYNANDIGLIVVATATPDRHFPSTACILQNRLGINNESPAFDLNAACAGFIYALSVADKYIRSGAVKSALVVGVDGLSRILDWSDRNTCVLFGDGAGAVLLEASESPGIISTKIRANGEYENLLYAPNALWEDEKESSHIKMQGSGTFKIAVKKLGEIVDEILQTADLSKEDVDWLIPHQANTRIIQAVAKRLNLPMEKVVLTIAEHGNTSAASVPLALDVAVRSGQIKRGETLLLEAFGGGFAWGAALVNY